MSKFIEGELILELNDQVYDHIVQLCNEGNTFVEKGKNDKAIESYIAALDLVLLPKNNWETSKWIYTALGDTYLNCDYEKGKSNLYNALNCPDGISNRLESMKQRILEQYGNPNRPTPNQLFEKYGSWEEVIYASTRSNPGMDVLTGLYDIYGED